MNLAKDMRLLGFSYSHKARFGKYKGL